MNSPNLSAQIEALRTALSASKSALDVDTRALLVTLRSELNERLVVTEPVQETAVEHLEAIALRFEAEHPTVGTAIREAINTLVKAGI